MSWDITGNANTDPNINFLGTTDGKPLVIQMNGNVGIGTKTPASKLQVQTSASGDGHGITHTDGTIIVGTYLGAAGGGAFGTKSNHPLSFFVNGGSSGNPSMTIDTSHNVGIGTIRPQAKLDISGGTTEGLHIANTGQSPIALMINNTTFGSGDATGFGFWQTATGIAVLTNNNNLAIGINSSGNVGIGTTTPASKLQVQTILGSDSYGITHTNGTIIVGTYLGLAGGGAFGTRSNHPLSFFVNGGPSGGPSGNPSMTITTSGNVGIGTTGPSTKLEVDGQTCINNIGAGSVNQLSFNEHGINWGHFYGDSYNRLYFGASNALTSVPSSPIMTWDLGFGSVGIGTTTPQAKLDISGGTTEGLRIANTNQSPFALMINNTTFGSYENQGFGFWQGDTGTAFLTNNNNHAISINSSGNVGIGANLTVQGDISVTGDVILTGADCAEEFDIAEAAEIEPGMVVVFDQGGTLYQCRRAYDKRVAGVISGAGDYKPGLILDRQQSRDNRLPVALVGKVYCKVDAQYTPIEVGDLLTTSPTPGHAMKADDPSKAFGSVIGKALHPLRDGQGLIPILIALQ